MRGRTNVSGGGGANINADVAPYVVAPNESIVAGNMVDFLYSAKGFHELYELTEYQETWCFKLSDGRYIVFTANEDSAYILENNNGEFSRNLDPITCPMAKKVFVIGEDKFVFLSTGSIKTTQHQLYSSYYTSVQWPITIKICTLDLATMVFTQISTLTQDVTIKQASGLNSYPTVNVGSQGKINVKIFNNLLYMFANHGNKSCALAAFNLADDTVSYVSVEYDVANTNDIVDFTMTDRGLLFFYNSTTESVNGNSGVMVNGIGFLRASSRLITIESGDYSDPTTYTLKNSDMQYGFCFLGNNGDTIYIAGCEAEPVDSLAKYYTKRININFSNLSKLDFLYYDKVDLDVEIPFVNNKKYPYAPLMRRLPLTSSGKDLLYIFSNRTGRLTVLISDLINGIFTVKYPYLTITQVDTNIAINLYNIEGICVESENCYIVPGVENGKVGVSECQYDIQEEVVTQIVDKETYVRNATNLKYIRGIAKDSGTAGQTIDVYLPSLITT